MRHYTTYVAIDVHTRSVTCVGIDVETGECFSKTFTKCPKDIEIVSWVKTLPQPAYCAYESGCCGFHLAKAFIKQGVRCDVIAISTLKASDKVKKNKSDKVDARHILHEITHPNPTYSVVYIPSDEQLAAKELSRSRADAVQKLKIAKQCLISFLHLYGFVYAEYTKSGNLKKRWTKGYYKWLGTISFEQDMLQDAFLDRLQAVKDAQKRLDDIESIIKEYAKREDIKPFIDAFRCVKGIDIYSAFLYFAEFSEFSRFKSGRKVASFVGMTPKNHSSGQRESKGHITKSGNKYIRKISIESLGAVQNWSKTNKTIPKDVSVSTAIVLMATDANTRIVDKHRRLMKRGKNSNIAKVACASELIKWVWAIGVQVEQELCAS